MKQTYEIDTANLTEEEKKMLDILAAKGKPQAFKIEYPRKGDPLYHIRSDGTIAQFRWIDNVDDKTRYEVGSIFTTLEEAKFERERRKVIFKLREYKRQFDNVELDWDNIAQPKYYIIYDGYSDRVEINSTERCKNGAIYFSSEKIAKDAVEAIGEDRIKTYYLGAE